LATLAAAMHLQCLLGAGLDSSKFCQSLGAWRHACLLMVRLALQTSGLGSPRLGAWQALLWHVAQQPWSS
jgi:aryl carrier-like protein